jgi:hypothetical protein
MKLIICPICQKMVDGYVINGVLTMYRGDGRYHSCGKDSSCTKGTREIGGRSPKGRSLHKKKGG